MLLKNKRAWHKVGNGFLYLSYWIDKYSYMKIVQTFWSAGATDQPLAIKAGWLGCEYHWMSWALSCLQFTKLYGAVSLVTDERGKEMLVNTLGLPYAGVQTVLDERLKNYPPAFWSLAKIVSFSLQQEPFLHVDGDFFAWHPFPEEVLQAPVVAQNLEVNLSYYRDNLTLIAKKWQHIPSMMQIQNMPGDIFAANTGVFGGHHLSFIQAYCKAAFTFLEENRAGWNEVRTDQLNFIFEQCLLYYLAAQEQVPIRYVMEEPVDEPSYGGYTRFEDVPNVPLIHTVAGYKQMPFVCGHLARRLRHDYPEYYYRIIQLCQEQGIALQQSIYNTPLLQQPALYPVWTNAARQQYLTTAAPVSNTGEKLPAAAFARSIAALQWLGQRVPADFFLEPEVAALTGNIENAICRERIEALIVLEKAVAVMQAGWAQESFVLWCYGRDMVQYGRVFSSDTLIQPSTVVQIDDLASVQWMPCNWEAAGVDDFAALAEEVLNGESSTQTLAVVLPDVLNGTILELYLEGLEAAVVQECVEPKPLESLLGKVRQHFDAAELEGNESAFEQLITDEVKRLVYTGILKI
jgi:hypothetical protein